MAARFLFLTFLASANAGLATFALAENAPAALFVSVAVASVLGAIAMIGLRDA